jgi:NAD(P)-dependent dehydrogenase (short-subunit alcohol dehydrogenase family)
MMMPSHTAAAAAAGRVGQPSDIAELVLFLADPARSGFITGQHFVADGGITKRMTYPE